MSEKLIQRLKTRIMEPELLSILFLLGLVLVFFWRVVFLGHTLLPLDLLSGMEPWASEGAAETGQMWSPTLSDVVLQFYPMGVQSERLWREGLPLWDPDVLGGMPALARGEMFTNPLFNLLRYFMPIVQAMSWAAIVHVFIAALFTWAYLRELGAGQVGALFAAVAFAFNGYLVGWMSFTVVLGSMVWLPVLLWAVERAIQRQDWRYSLVGALAFVLQLLSGGILWALYTSITVAIILFYRTILQWVETRTPGKALRPLLYGGIAMVVGTALAAPAFLQTLELYFHTMRSEKIGAVSFVGLPQVVRLFAPLAYGSGVRGDDFRLDFNYPETGLYFGVLTLFLILASAYSTRRKLAWIFGGLGLLTYLAVFGIFPADSIVSVLFPVFLNTFPGRIFYVSAFTWSVAAGLGADWILNARPRMHLKLLNGAMLVFSALAAGLLVFSEASEDVGRGERFFEAKSQLQIPQMDPRYVLIALVWLLIGFLLFYAWGSGRLRKGAYGALCLGILIVDLFSTGINYNPAFPSGGYFAETESLSALKGLLQAEKQPVRIAPIPASRVLPGMNPLVYGLPTISGYSSWVLLRYAEYVTYTDDMEETTLNQLYPRDCCHPLIDALNVKYIYSSPEAALKSQGDIDLIYALGTAEMDSKRREQIHATSWTIDGIYREVLYLHPPASLRYALDITQPCSFTASIAIDPVVWQKSGDGAVFEIFIEAAGARRQQLFHRQLDPVGNPDDRGWHDVEVDLSDYVGQRIYLTLSTDPGPLGDSSNDWAGWGAPRVKNYLPASLELVFDGALKIYENKEAFPRAWIVHRLKAAAEGDLVSAGRTLADVSDLAVEAVVEIETIPEEFIRAGSVATSLTEKALVESYSANRVEITAQLEQPGLLVLADNYYPGWVATVDGNETPILATNLTMRGVLLQPGSHRIVFEYRPRLLKIGLLISLLTVMLLASVLVFDGLQRRRQKG